MSKVRPIPEGFHTITPHLVVKGAKQAIAFYERAFAARVLACHIVEGSEQVMHASLTIGDSQIMLNDEFPEMGAVGPKESSPVTIHLYVEDVDAWWQRALAAGATPLMPLANAFWGDRYGVVRDPFGHLWSLASRVEEVSPEQLQERARAAFAGNGGC